MGTVETGRLFDVGLDLTEKPKNKIGDVKNRLTGAESKKMTPFLQEEIAESLIHRETRCLW